MEEIVIEEMNYKAFAISLANLFLLIAAIAIMIVGIGNDYASYWLIGLMFSMILLVSFIISVVKVMQVKKLLTITFEGIEDNSSVGGVGFISYEDIKEFLILTVYNKKAIAVLPKNVDNFLSKFNLVKRSQMKRNLNLNLPPVTIFVDMAKDMEPEDILSLLKKRLNDYNSLG